MLDIDGISGGVHSGVRRVGLAHEGTGTRMPNLDLIAAAALQFEMHTGGFPLHLAAPEPSGVLQPWSLLSTLHGHMGVGCSTKHSEVTSGWSWRCMIAGDHCRRSTSPYMSGSAYGVQI